MPNLFISYSRSDEASVRAVVHCLKERGVELWFDRDNISPSQDTIREIDSALEQCSHFLLFASQSYFDSEWATAEYRAALYTALSTKTVSVVVVKLDSVPLPALLAPLNYIFFTNPKEVCDKIAGLLPPGELASQEQQPSPASKCSWDSMDDALLYLLIDTLFSNLNALQQQAGFETILQVNMSRSVFFELTISLPLIKNEMLMADIQSEWRIFKVLKKTINSYIESLRKGGLGIFQPAFEISLDEKLTELNCSRSRINAQFSAIVPVIRRYESKQEK